MPENASAELVDRDKRIAELEAEVSGLQAEIAEVRAKLDEASAQAAASAAERDAWQAKAAALYEQYQRTKSDFESFKRRTERDFEERVNREKAGLLRALLEVADNFDRFVQATERALVQGPEPSFSAFLDGAKMIERHFMETLLKEGVERVPDPVGSELDPSLHEAVAAEEGGVSHGVVLEELQKGYTYKGIVLRPSKVKVAK